MTVREANLSSLVDHSSKTAMRHRAASQPFLTLVLIGAAGLVLAVPSPPPPPLATPRPELLALFQDYWHWKTQDYPQFATQVGINDNTAGRLDSLSMKHFESRKAKCEEFLQRAYEIDTSLLSPDDLVNLKVFKDEMITFIDNFPYMKYYAPVNLMDGPQINFRNMVQKQMVLQEYNDYQKLLSRYGEFPRQAQEILALLKGNIESGLMPSNWSLVGVVDQLDSFSGAVEDSVFYKPFIHMPHTITTEQRTTLRQQAQERIKQDLMPSFKKIRDFIVSEYLPATRSEEAVTSLPGGEDYYRACLKFHTSTNLTPQEIHTLGMTEVARVEEEAQKTAAEIDMEGKTFAEISQALKADTSFGFSSKSELLDYIRHTLYSVIYPRVFEMFPDLPSTNVTVEGNDDPNAVLAKYSSSSIDGTRPGTYVISTHNPARWKKFELMAVTLHEAVPGHHLQSIYGENNPSTPNFRKFADFTFGLNAPARFPPHNVFVEGWGLYAEFLGEELNLYRDPYEKLGRYSFELLRASRLVVDTGIHALGWSRDRAMAFLQDHTALAKETIGMEVNRYITYPGQACAYKIGEIKIKELRQKAQNALGSLFRLLDFHNVLLGCSGPVKILEECITNYIEQTNSVMEKGGEEKEDEESSKAEESKSADQDNGDADANINISDTPNWATALLAPSVAMVLTVCVVHLPLL
ncbi:uncharacterized protein LOC126998670 isoform X2 [Eriocheir sinensis]|nr:uncharacterized protein LOC126998670 isoform X2 [Eriocheir sinensis]